jgi:proline iminopeptidase
MVDERYLPVDGAELYVREIGAGHPIVVLHGGPDFDHGYLVPELDEVALACRLIYYDQRGRGRSAGGVRPEDVTIESEVDDLDQVRVRLELGRIAVLGHSWGGLLAMEYATRHPEHVSHLILMNTAPASGRDADRFRARLRASRPPGDVERMQTIAGTASYMSGDLKADADYYRIHFRSCFRQSAQLEELLRRLRANFTPETMRLARAIEDRMYEQTWSSDGYDLIPKLRALDAPTLVMHGGRDFVPLYFPVRIAQAIPRSRLVVLPGCGHFSYAERPDLVRQHIAALVGGAAVREQ